MNLKQTRIAYWAGVVLALAVLVCAQLLSESNRMMMHLLMILGVLSFAAANLNVYSNWRCPDCGRVLPMRGLISIACCPYCGTELFPG